MATLGDLKAEIADDLARSDLTTQIASAINSAIRNYQSHRFYFNETRDTTFNTVASQIDYGASDEADIPEFIEIDAIYTTISGTVIEMDADTPQNIETLTGVSATRGQPTTYAYFNKALRLYPIPDQAYPVRMQGLIRKAAPADDADPDNVWMIEAYELIRSRAKKMLGLHVIKDAELVSSMDAAERMALGELDAQTSQRIATGKIRPTIF